MRSQSTLNKGKKRIFMIYDRLYGGGIENHVVNILKELAKISNLKLYLFTQASSFNIKSSSLLPENVEIIYIKESKMKRFNLMITAFRYIISISKEIIYNKSYPHIIHVHTLMAPGLAGYILKSIFKVKLIITVHESSFIENLTKEKLIYKIYYKFLLNKADAILSVSKEIKNLVYNLVGKNKIIVEIPNGVNTVIFTSYPLKVKNKIRKSMGFGEKDFILLCPRRIARKNGIIYLLKTANNLVKKIDNIKFLIIGKISEPNYWIEILEFIHRNDLEKYVIYVGSVPQEKMALYYNISDITVLPSLIEGISLAALEALSCGNIVVASRTGGLSEIIKDGTNGFLINPLDLIQFENTIISIYEKMKTSPVYINNIRKNAMETAKKYSWDKVTQKILKIYDMVMRMK